jgi:hypothetical protein
MPTEQPPRFDLVISPTRQFTGLTVRIPALAGDELKLHDAAFAHVGSRHEAADRCDATTWSQTERSGHKSPRWTERFGRS